MSAEDPGVLAALGRQRDWEAAAERKRKREIEDLRQTGASLQAQQKKLKNTKALLADKRKALADVEGALEAKHAIRAFAPKELGVGRPKGGGAQGAKTRQQVLDRLARLGRGLSPAQRNEFGWWKEAWDERMLEQHGGEWPALFATWAQSIVEKHQGGEAAAFSAFVHSETQRVLSEEVALVVP